MSRISSTRRTAAAIVCAAGAVGATTAPSANAMAPADGCRFLSGTAIKIGFDGAKLPNYAPAFLNAVAAWNRSAKVEMTGASSRAASHIWVRGGYTGHHGGTYTPTSVNGYCTGTAEIVIDPAMIARRGNPIAVAQAVMSHEIGHALGLGHDETRLPSPRCPDGTGMPASVMIAAGPIFNKQSCGQMLPTAEDIKAVDVRYK